MREHTSLKLKCREQNVITTQFVHSIHFGGKISKYFPNKTTISNNNNVTDLHGHDDRSELTTAAGRRQLAVVDLRRGGCT